MKKLRVLVACEFSGIVREAFKARGHDAWSCDLLDTEIPGQHIKGDVLEQLDKGWDLMIAHPPRDGSLEIQDNEWFPLGQRVIKSGYKPITRDELSKLLGIEYIFSFHDQIRFCSLKTYTEEIIPLQQMQDIRKAKNIGIKNFRIYYPKDENKPDPVIVGLIGNKEFYITKW